MDDLMLVGGGRVRWWGSDCTLEGGCEGNTTPDSMRCDNCGSDRFTIPLYGGTRVHTLAADQGSVVVEMKVAGAITLTVPTNATIAFPVGTVIGPFVADQPAPLPSVGP